MAWGVLEDKKTPFPAGTSILNDELQQLKQEAALKENPNLKKNKKNIVLRPQPSDSPNDPLNWPLWYKSAIFITLIISQTAVGGIQAMLGYASRILAEEFDITYAQLIRALNPPAIAAGGIALFFASAFAAVWGKRLTIFVCIVIIWATLLVGYFANSLGYYVGITIVYNIFGAAPQLLTVPIFIDLVFVHQRGKYLAVTTVAAIVGIDVSNIISGNIIVHLGIKYLYVISFCVFALLLVLVFLFVPETTYNRKRILESKSRTSTSDDEEVDTSADEARKLNNGSPEPARRSVEQHEESVNKAFVSSYDEDTERRRPISWYLRIYHGRVTDRNLFWSFVQPFPLILFPSVLFATVVNGAMITWVTISNIVTSYVLLYPPYNIKANTLSYLALPGSGMALLFSLIAGWSSDWLVKAMAKRNRGVYEPEFRLVMLIPAVAFSTAAFLLLGPLYNHHAPVYQIILANLLFSIAMPFGSTACVTYIMDTMQDASTEAFVATTLFNSIYGFLATYYVPGWFADHGPLVTYRALAILNLAFGALGVPMYVLGKKWRGIVARTEWLRRTAGQLQMGDEGRI